MFSFFQDTESNSDSIITLDKVNQKLHDKRKQTLSLAFASIFFLGHRCLIDSIMSWFINDPSLSNQVSLAIYCFFAMSALYFIFSLVQETSNLMSQRDEINQLLLEC